MNTITKEEIQEMQEDELQRWLASRKEAGRVIDIETCELDLRYVQTMDPYGVRDLPPQHRHRRQPKNLSRRHPQFLPCPVQVAHLRHLGARHLMHVRCRGETRHQRQPGLRTAFDPGRVKTCTRGECAELFSLFSPFDGACQSGSFLIQRNRNKRSTRKFEVGVFTQPGPEPDV
jgi:hypothetical protein